MKKKLVLGVLAVSLILAGIMFMSQDPYYQSHVGAELLPPILAAVAFAGVGATIWELIDEIRGNRVQ